MTQASSFNSFFNQPFGLNVKVPERTLKQAGDTLSGTASGVFEPLFTYLEENENVFTGDISNEIRKINVASFNIGARMQAENVKVNGAVPKFDSKF